MKPEGYEPITDERLEYLDDWYTKQTSNSIANFCDADYWGLRDRIKKADEIVDLLDRMLTKHTGTADVSMAKILIESYRILREHKG